MDRGFRLGQSLEQRFRPIATREREGCAIDEREDLRQAAVGMLVMLK